jgi:hypothetical protein
MASIMAISLKMAKSNGNWHENMQNENNVNEND